MWEKEAAHGSTAGICDHCKGPITDQAFLENGPKKLHNKCFDAYQAAKKGACVHCKKAIEEKFLNLPDGAGRLHPECKAAYEQSRRGTCGQCGKPLGVESIELSSAPGLAFHEECVNAYKQAKRPKCQSCGQVIMDNSYVADKAGNCYHANCTGEC